MNALQIAPDYIRDERDFLTPLSPMERLRQLIAPQAYPTNWMPGIDISGIGQTKEIASAFPTLFAQGWKFIIMRASIGTIPDSLFEHFWNSAFDAGMYMMAYHLGWPPLSGTVQADVFLKAIDPMLTAVDCHSAAVIDVEVPGDVNVWRKMITDFHTAVKPTVRTGDYSSVSKWLSCTNNMPVPGFAWNASWSSLTDVQSFAPALQTLLRQVGVYLKHDWVPKPPGVNEDVDVDYWMGTEEQLRKFLGYEEAPPPPPSDLETRLNALALEVKNNKTEVTNSLNELTTKTLKVEENLASLESRVEKLEQGGVPSTKPRFQIGGTRANCRVVVGMNKAVPPKPIMDIPPVGPHRIQFDAGKIVLLASNVKVDADGSVDYYQVDPSQYLKGEPDQYLRTTDGILLPSLS